MSRDTARSKELFERALEVMVEGGSSPSRGPANYGEYPLFLDRAAGAHVWDADGNEYIDWMLAYGALPLGHAHAAVVEAVTRAAATGNLLAAAAEIEVEVAELVSSMIPGAEKVRFANTGTEATMAAIRLARGMTGRPKFIKFEGHYHGWYDDFLASSHPVPAAALGHRNNPVKIPDSSGLNRRALDDTIVVPWNDLDAVERAIADNRGQLAAVITLLEEHLGAIVVATPSHQQPKLVQAHGCGVVPHQTVLAVNSYGLAKEPLGVVESTQARSSRAHATQGSAGWSPWAT